MKFLTLKYAGGLQLDQVTINLDQIVSIQKPKSETYGCIISTTNGEKFPVEDSYDEVIESIMKMLSCK